MDCSMNVALVSSTGCGGLQQAAAACLKLVVTRAPLMGQLLRHSPVAAGACQQTKPLVGWCAAGLAARPGLVRQPEVAEQLVVSGCAAAAMGAKRAGGRCHQAAPAVTTCPPLAEL